MDYELNEEGDLIRLDIKVKPTAEGIKFISPIDNSTYFIEGVTEQDLESMEMARDVDFAWEILNMVSELGGGKWRDDPSGTFTSYEYDSETKILQVIED